MFSLIPKSILSSSRVSASSTFCKIGLTSVRFQSNIPLGTDPSVIGDAIISGKASNLFNFKTKSSHFSKRSQLDGSGDNVTFSALKAARELPAIGHDAARSVRFQQGRALKSIGSFNQLVYANNLKRISANQRFYLKPSKRLSKQRFNNNKKRFDKGIQDLFGVVRRAVAMGY